MYGYIGVCMYVSTWTSNRSKDAHGTCPESACSLCEGGGLHIIFGPLLKAASTGPREQRGLSPRQICRDWVLAFNDTEDRYKKTGVPNNAKPIRLRTKPA